MTKKFSKIYKNASNALTHLSEAHKIYKNALIGVKIIKNSLETITNGIDRDFPEIGVRDLPEYQEVRDNIGKWSHVIQEAIYPLEKNSNEILKAIDSIEKFLDTVSNKVERLDNESNRFHRKRFRYDVK